MEYFLEKGKLYKFFVSFLSLDENKKERCYLYSFESIFQQNFHLDKFDIEAYIIDKLKIKLGFSKGMKPNFILLGLNILSEQKIQVLRNILLENDYDNIVIDYESVEVKFSDGKIEIKNWFT